MVLNIIDIIIGIITGSGLTAIIILVYLIKNPEKIEKWASMFYRLFCFASKKSERNYIKTNIQSVANEQRKKLDLDERGLSYGLKIKWSDSETIEADLDKNNLVVMMRPYQSQAKNMAHIFTVYIPESLLPKARKYVEPNLMRGIDHFIIKEFLSENSTAMNYFINNLTTISTDDSVLIDQLQELNSVGYLTRIIIPEFEKLGALYPRPPDNASQVESLELHNCIFNFVETINSGKLLNGQGIFRGKNLNMAIIPVGSPRKLLQKGIEKHCNFIKKQYLDGIKYFYIVSNEDVKSHFTKFIKKMCEELKLSVIFEEEYNGLLKGKKQKLICALLVADLSIGQ